MKNTKVTFKIATQPNADNFTLAVRPAMVTREREMISIRTRWLRVGVEMVLN